MAGNQEESDDDLMEQFRVPRIIRQSPIDGLLPHIPSSPTQLDSDASLTELLQGVQESVVTVVTSAVDTVCGERRGSGPY